MTYGNKVDLSIRDSNIQLSFSAVIPTNLEDYDALMIFSTANSKLTGESILAIEKYVLQGGSLYLGADNWPFVEECDQLTTLFFRNQCYGYFDDSIQVSETTNLNLEKNQLYYAGITTVSFPMNFQLRVDAWVNDNPIILSGKFGKGKILLDGGYSRFQRPKESQVILNELLHFLLDH